MRTESSMATTRGRNVRFLFVVMMFAPIALPVTGNAVARPERDTSEDVKQETVPRLCLTPECVDTAARIRQFIDPNVDPCDDFYEFACGNWKKNQILSPDMTLTPSFQSFDNKIATLKNILSEEPKPTDLDSIVKAKHMYTSCIAYATKKRDFRELKDFIEKEFGAWPLTLTEWDDSSFDFEAFLAKEVQLGVATIMGLRTFFGFLKNKETGWGTFYSTLEMYPPMRRLEKLTRLVQGDLRMRNIYKDKIFKTAKIFGVENEARAKQDIEDMLDFETALINITFGERNYTGEFYERAFTLRNLEDECGQADIWRKVLMKLLSSPEVGVKEFQYDTVVVEDKEYFRRLSNYLPDVKKRTLANYIIWRVVYTLESVLIPDAEEMNFLYKEVLEGSPRAIPAQKSCMNYVAKAFGHVLHRLMYVAKFPEEEMHHIRVMTNKILNIFDDRLEEMDWLDVQTKTVVLEKRRAIEIIFLHFDTVMNDIYLDNLYSNLKVNKGDFFNNLLAELKERVNEVVRHVGERVNPSSFRADWTSGPWAVKASMESEINIMGFSASIFEPPFFTNNVPQSLNFGGIGVVLGHELTHAFIDKRGWSEEALSNIKQRHRCMGDQYGDFYFSEAGMYVNGNRTRYENIADNGGLGQSFNAYRSWICSRGEEEETLPSIPYNNNQLFFISFAHLWCAVISEKDAQGYKSDVHSPPRFRVIGTLQNSKEFAEAFNCPAGSYMNPTAKCEVW